MGVRRETVVLELIDSGFSTGVAKDAALVAVLNREVGNLSDQSVQTAKTTRVVSKEIDELGSSSRRADKDIDKLSGRLAILGAAVGAIGPAALPIGALAVPALSGLVSVTGFATLAAGASALAFRGLGDVLDTVNKARLEPTVENLDAARAALANLSPETRGFVKEIQQFIPALDHLSQTAANGLFPGLGEGLSGLQATLPKIEKVVSAITEAVGDAASDAGSSLAGGDWDEFFTFLETEGPDAVKGMVASVGNLTHGLAELWMATQPLNGDFLSWLTDSTEDFDRWAAGLDETQGFEDFLAYVDETGPQVGETLGAIGNAFLQIVQATAPLGGPVLQVLESMADVIAKIADSPLGTPLLAAVTAMSALTLATKTYGAVAGSSFGRARVSTQSMIKDLRTMQSVGIVAWARTTEGANRYAAASARVSAQSKTLAKQGAILGGLALVGTGAAEKIGLANTASFALAGSIAGPWGAAIGGGIGLATDLASANDGLADALERVNTAAKSGDLASMNAGLAEARKNLKDIEDTSGVGDFLHDTLVRPLSHPLDSLAFWTESEGEKAKKEIEKTESSARKEYAKTVKAAFELEQHTNDVAKAQAKQAQSSAQQAEAMSRVSASWRTLGTDINNAKVSLDDWIQSQADQAKAMQGAAGNAETLLGRGLRASKVQELLDAGPEGALRLQQLAKGTDAQIRALNKAQGSFIRGQKDVKEAIARTAAELAGLTYRPYMLRIDANTSPAEAALAQLRADIGRMHLTVKVTASTNATVAEAGNGADGATVPKTGLPYADRHLYLLADGERIISNRYGQADRHSSLLDSINSDHRMAGGGVAGGHPALNAYIRNDLDMKAPDTLKEWNKALKASTNLLEKEKDKRQALLDQADSVRSAIASNYKSDLFGGANSSSVWMSATDRMKAGTGDVFSTLIGDNANLDALKAAIAQLKKKGLDGAALATLLSEGSLQDVQGLAGSTAADVQRFESLFNLREQKAAAVGNVAAAASFGALQAVANRQYQEAKKATAALTRVGNLLEKNPDATGAAIARAINRAGPSRPKKG